MNSWYKDIKKSKLSPPNWVFGVVWPILYIFLAIIFYDIAVNSNVNNNNSAMLFVLFSLGIVLNLAWTTVFFKYRKTGVALIMTLSMIMLSIWLYIKMKQMRYHSAPLLLPYVIWLCFAFYLNAYIFAYN